MKNCIKKLVVTGALTVITAFTIMSTTNAATVKVTGDTLNVRKSPSTDSKVVAMLYKGVECELLGEEGDWYKIKYKSYTGYISKQYSEIIGGNEEQEESNTENKEENNVTEKENNTEVKEENIKAEDITGEKETSKQPETVEITYKKAKKDLNIKILPLVYSDSIGKESKGTEVVLLSQTTGWSYIQTETISGWVRSDTLQDSDKKQENVSDSNKNTDNNKEDENKTSKEENSYTQKTAYINENLVNVRKGAGTSYDVIKTLTLNSKVTITGEEDGWYKVKSGNDEGYILKEFLSDNQKVTTRSNTSNRTENKVVETTEKDEETKTTTKTENITETKKEETTEKKTETKKEETIVKKEESKKEQTTTKTEVKEENKETIKDTDVIAYAKKYLGYKYVYGGNGSDGTFDCSGFTMYVYKHFGISLPHGATSQYKSGKGTKISKQSDLEPGDIVFLTDYETGVGIGHCGIYIGNGNFIHASTTTYSVIISSLNTKYEGRFYAGLRLI